MTKDEVKKLFLLLKQFYPNKKHDANFKLAWEMALKPYTYDDVKEAALEYTRTNRFFPDISEIIGLLKSTDKDDQEPDDNVREREKDRKRYRELKKYILPDREINPVTRYAGENHMTIGQAEKALGKTWAQAQEEMRAHEGTH